MDLQHRISQERIRHIVESYLLSGDEPTPFESYLSELLSQYPHGVIELALVETLVKSWLTIPMVKGVAFLSATHEKLKQWQQSQSPEAQSPEAQSPGTQLPETQLPEASLPSLTPSQFTQITGLDAQAAFTALASFSTRSSAQATAEPV